MVVRLEAFDLSERGFDTSYFRRQMAILAKLQKSGAVESEKLLGTFTKEEIEEIYPPLSKVMVRALADELELMGYVATVGGTVAATPKGEAKLQAFREGLPADHLEAFERYVR